MTVEFLIDTAFDGDLALPPAIVAQLQAVPAMSQIIRTADGRTSLAEVFETELSWDGGTRPVYVLVLGGESPLVGIRLLAEHSIYLEMTDGGTVTIEPF